MGDADNTQNMMSVEDVEALMENAWNDLDDGLDGLCSFVSLLTEQNAYMMSEMASWQRVRRCFVALNVFVIPVMLSIWIAFGSTDLVRPDSGTEAGLQAIVTALMFVSGVIGFPLYVIALLRTVLGAEEEARCCNGGLATNRKVVVSETSLPPFGGDSLERISGFARLTNRRFMDNVRQDLERRVSRAEEVEQSARFEPSERDADDVIGVPDSGSDSSSDHKEETDFCGFKVIILNKTRDLSVEIEKQEDEECRVGSIRSIAVENVGEGDSSRVCPQQSLAKDCWQEQVFGL